MIRYIVVALMLSSCAIPIKNQVDPRVLIANTAERDVLAIFLTLYQRNDIEKASVISTDCISEMTKFVFPLLSRPDTEIVRASEQMLFSKLSKIDQEYQVSMSRSIDTLHLYYTPPAVDRALDDKSRENLTAFFKGVEAGCREGI